MTSRFSSCQSNKSDSVADMALPLVPHPQGELAATAVNAPMVSAEVLAELQPYVALAQGLGTAAVQLVGSHGFADVYIIYASPRGGAGPLTLPGRTLYAHCSACLKCNLKCFHGEQHSQHAQLCALNLTCVLVRRQVCRAAAHERFRHSGQHGGLVRAIELDTRLLRAMAIKGILQQISGPSSILVGLM